MVDKFLMWLLEEFQQAARTSRNPEIRKLRNEKAIFTFVDKFYFVFKGWLWSCIKAVFNYLNPFFWYRYHRRNQKFQKAEEKLHAFKLFKKVLKESKNPKYYGPPQEHIVELSLYDIIKRCDEAYWAHFIDFCYNHAKNTERGPEIEEIVFSYVSEFREHEFKQKQYEVIFHILKQMLKPLTIQFYIAMFMRIAIYEIQDLRILAVHLKYQIPIERMTDIELLFSRNWVFLNEYDFYCVSKSVVTHITMRYGKFWVYAGKLKLSDYYDIINRPDLKYFAPKPQYQHWYYEDSFLVFFRFFVKKQGRFLMFKKTLYRFYIEWLRPDFYNYFCNFNFYLFFIFFFPYLLCFIFCYFFL